MSCRGVVLRWYAWRARSFRFNAYHQRNVKAGERKVIRGVCQISTCTQRVCELQHIIVISARRYSAWYAPARRLRGSEVECMAA